MANKWIEFVKKWASDKKMTYSAALKDPKLKTAYGKTKTTDKSVSVKKSKSKKEKV